MVCFHEFFIFLKSFLKVFFLPKKKENLKVYVSLYAYIVSRLPKFECKLTKKSVNNLNRTKNKIKKIVKTFLFSIES
jgi:hypothetical protein